MIGSCLVLGVTVLIFVAPAMGICSDPILDSRALFGICALSGSICVDCGFPRVGGGGWINCSYDFDGHNTCPQPGIPGPYPILASQEGAGGITGVRSGPAGLNVHRQVSTEAIALARMAGDSTLGTLVAGYEPDQDSPILPGCSDDRLFNRLLLAQATLEGASR